MNLKDRIALLKGGYTKKEIEALIEAESKAEELKAPEETNIEDTAKEDITYGDVIKALVDEVKDLKNTIYANNINSVEIEKPVSLENEAEKVLASLINPFNNKTEEK